MFSTLKFAFRSLRKTPGFTAVVVLTLALGIGANTAIFSLFEQFVLRSLSVPEPDRLVNLSAPGPRIGSTSSGIAGGSEDVFSYPMFRDLERMQDVFTGIAAHQLFKANLAYKGQVKDGAGLFVSGSYFPVLGVHPALGRLLGPADDSQTGANPVAVLSYDYWQSHFGSNPNVLNDALIVNGKLLTIVGVAPRGFSSTIPGVKPQVFVPITLKGTINRRDFNLHRDFENRQAYWLNLFARLKPGISAERARTRINVAYRAVLNDVEAPLQVGMSPQTLARFRAKEIVLSEGARGRSQFSTALRTPFLLLLGVTALVLLIACSNIANLLLARYTARSSEIALRLSLGASRWQILVQLLAESCLFAVFGGIAGLACAYWTEYLTALFLPTDFSGTLSARIDGTALLFTTGLTGVVVLLFGLMPALRGTQADLSTMIKSQGGSIASARGTVRLRATLIGGQTVMAMLLLVSAGLLIKSLSNIGRVDLGVKVDSLVTLRISPELNGYTPVRSRALFERLEENLAAIPGVTGVTASFIPILADTDENYSVSVQGYSASAETSHDASLNKIGTDYFRTLGIPLISGREFNMSDAAGTAPVAIVNEQFVRKFNLGADAIGKWMGYGGDKLNLRIVGVVQNAKYSGVKGETPPQFFLPYRQDDTLGAMSFYVRAVLPPEQVLSLAAKAVAHLDPTLPIENPKTMARQVEDNVFLDRLISVLCTAFAALATLLAAIGLYGMLAYAVAQRTKEIGVRMALGAQPHRVAWPIVRNALGLAMVGVVVGGLIALALARVVRGILFGVEPDDPSALIGAGILLFAIAGAAAWIPAWRASKVNPIVALRTE
jgi:predicted permease